MKWPIPAAAAYGYFLRMALSAAIVLTFSCLLVAPPVIAQDIWFAPPAAPADTRLNRAADFMDLFTTDAPWRQAASHVKVFKLYPSYLSRAPQEEIDRIVADLNRRHIAIALEVGVMNVGPAATHPPCGGFGLVEGYGTPQVASIQAKKIKQAGGLISFISMDEPLWYGHYFNGRRGEQRGCHSSIAQIVALIKEPLAVYREEFPNIVVGDTEPTVIAEQPGWKEDLLAWVDGFRDQAGHPLAFMHLDIPFARPNEEGFAVSYYAEVERLKQQGKIQAIGIIYDGTPADSSDEAWVMDAKAHIRLLEDKDHLLPDQALIQSWQAYPRYTLPESSSGSLTGLVDFYAGRKAR